MCAHDHTKNNNSEKRYFPRWEVATPVSYSSQDCPESQKGYTKDLSCAGACIAAHEVFLLSQKLNLSIHLSQTKTVEVQGQVVWQNIFHPPYTTGITFYNTTDEAQDSILSHAFHIDKKKVFEHWYDGWGESNK